MKLLPLGEHHLLVFWVQLVALVLLARLLGGAMRRIGQPAVIGELAAGVVLGPSVFGRVWPAGAAWLFPPDPVQAGLLLVVGWLGIVMLLILTGFETDLGLIRQLGRAAAAVATMSVVMPFALGLGAGYVLPRAFLARPEARLPFALFIAAALSISSLPVIAKILSELGLTRRNFGQLTLAAGMANDVIGWLILGAIAGIARSGSIELGRLGFTILGMAAFVVGMLTIGQRAVDFLLRRARAQRTGIGGAMTVTLLVAFAAGAITQALEVEAVLGAFIAGIVLGRSKYQDSRVPAHLETATLTVFAPLFFATAGLRVDLGVLARWDVLLWAGVVIVIASIGKFVGAWLGGLLARLPTRESLALGVGLNARGALEIVIATVGLSLGVLNNRMYTIVVVMAILTSMAAPPLFRAVVRGWTGTPEEQKRLEHEEVLRNNVLVRHERMLLPVQQGDGSVLAAKLLDAAWPADAEATVVSVGEGEAPGVEDVGAVIERRPMLHEHLPGADAVVSLVDHMALSYGVVGMGAWEGRGNAGILSPLTEALLAQTSLPVVVVWDGSGDAAEIARVGGFRRILVPVVGTVPSRAAQEVAASMAATTGATLVLAHITVPDATRPRGGTFALSRSGRSIGEGIVAEAAHLARRLGVRPLTVVREGTSRAEEIAQLADEVDADLVVLSDELQPVAGTPFLGNLVEDVIERTHRTVAVVAMPHAWRGDTAA
jgi:Kef-type K+ transport system membrane component KefB